MQECLQEIVFKNPTTTALTLTAMILSAGRDTSRCLPYFGFLHQLRRRTRHRDLTVTIAAAKIAEKITNLVLFHFSKVKFAI